VQQEDADHLINAIKKYYPITVDKEAKKYIGLAIEWDYAKPKGHIHMPDYLQKAFTRFKHEAPEKIQNSPHPRVIPQYRAKTHYAKDDKQSTTMQGIATKRMHAAEREDIFSY